MLVRLSTYTSQQCKPSRQPAPLNFTIHSTDRVLSAKGNSWTVLAIWTNVYDCKGRDEYSDGTAKAEEESSTWVAFQGLRLLL